MRRTNVATFRCLQITGEIKHTDVEQVCALRAEHLEQLKLRLVHPRLDIVGVYGSRPERELMGCVWELFL